MWCNLCPSLDQTSSGNRRRFHSPLTQSSQSGISRWTLDLLNRHVLLAITLMFVLCEAGIRLIPCRDAADWSFARIMWCRSSLMNLSSSMTWRFVWATIRNTSVTAGFADSPLEAEWCCNDGLRFIFEDWLDKGHGGAVSWPSILECFGQAMQRPVGGEFFSSCPKGAFSESANNESAKPWWPVPTLDSNVWNLHDAAILAPECMRNPRLIS